MKMRRKKKGFTLIEMVIVIAIMGILVGLVAPGAAKALNNAKVQSDAANARNIATAIIEGQANDDINFDSDAPDDIDGAVKISDSGNGKPKGLTDYLSNVPEVKAVKKGHFEYYVKDGNLHIVASDNSHKWELYPELNPKYPDSGSDDL